MLKNAEFLKMNGLGNEIIIIDMRGRFERINPEIACAIHKENTLSFDQIMVVYDPKTVNTTYYLEIINRDGSLSGTCGNGMRCVTHALAKHSNQTHFIFETPAGLVHTHTHENGIVSVDMGKPEFDWKRIPLSEKPTDEISISLQKDISDDFLYFPSFVSMGNPHAIFWASQDVQLFRLQNFGSLLENHSLFPERANISIAQITSQKSISMRTWERGTGLTKACGSAACAATVCAARNAYTRRSVTVSMPGGELQVAWRQKDDHVIMTGSSEEDFTGILNPETGEVSIHR